MRRLTISGMPVLLAAAVLTAAAGEESPPLSPPAELPALELPSLPTSPEDPAPSPAAELVLPPSPAPAPSPAWSGPVLAVPGLPSLRPPSAMAISPAREAADASTPAGFPLVSPAPALPNGPANLDGPPPLVGPADLAGSAPTIAPLSRPRYSSSAAPDLGRSSISLEPGRVEGLGDPTARPRISRAPGSAEDAWATPPPPEPTRRRLFGILPLPPSRGGRAAESQAVPPPARPRLDLAARGDADEAISDDLMMERRLRAQIRSSVGGNLRSLDVRVVDHDVYIRAEARFFWQKRAIRRELETMPMLTGYRARIYVD